MYRVAIIDDEPLIVEGLCRTMPWEKWDCQVVGCAYNGAGDDTAGKAQHYHHRH